MKYSFLMLIFGVLAGSCQNIEQSTGDKQGETYSPDTVVGKKSITHELAGGTYRTRATEYFLVIHGDTSDLSIYLSEYKENSRILGFKHRYLGHNNISYQQRLDELPALLREAQKDYNLDSLTGINLNTMVTNGDLAIKVTDELLQAFPEYKTNPSIKEADYSRIFEFLKESQLAKDLNDIFAPYDLVVNSIGGEKLYFEDKDWLYKNSIVETDSTLVPDRILNGAFGVSMKKKP